MDYGLGDTRTEIAEQGGGWELGFGLLCFALLCCDSSRSVKKGKEWLCVGGLLSFPFGF